MTLTDSIEYYERLRYVLLGSEVGLQLESPGPTDDVGGFDAFVSLAYVAVRETLADDASFFKSIDVLGSHPAPRTLYLLRTARQHSDNQQAVEFYENWLGDAPVDWNVAVERLCGQVKAYIDLLIQGVLVVRDSPALRMRWVDVASVSVPMVFDSVCQDLSLRFSGGARNAKVRAIQGRYQRERPSGPKRIAIAELCVQEALSESIYLPVQYADLLDELGLLRSRDASAVLNLAYATARKFPGLKGEAFKRKTSELWWSLVGH